MPLLPIALSHEPRRTVAEEDVEGGEAAVAAGDVALQLELLFRRQRRMAVELLLDTRSLSRMPMSFLRKTSMGTSLACVSSLPVVAHDAPTTEVAMPDDRAKPQGWSPHARHATTLGSDFDF
jgi:hypothetical protein